jgi:hypothetical protein
MSARHALALVLPLAALAGCTAHGSAIRSEPRGKRAAVAVADVPVKGFDVTVFTDAATFSGELLAVDSCYVHVERPAGAVAIPVTRVESVGVQLYPSTAAGSVALLSVLGTLSTPSHGWYLVFSVPVWLTSGIATSVNLAYADDVTVKDSTFLFQFARFPQGLPPGWREAEALPGTPMSCKLSPPPAVPPAARPHAPPPATPPPADEPPDGGASPPPTAPPSDLPAQ